MTANPQEDQDMPGSRKAVVTGAEEPGDRELDIAIAELGAASQKLPRAAIQWIREHRDMVDPMLVRQKDIERSISEGDSWVRGELDRCGPIGIQDPMAELETWAAFREEPPASQRPEPPKPEPHAEVPARSEPSPLSQLPRRRVGRNEPCPCGSGKKYKKCCGLQV